MSKKSIGILLFLIVAAALAAIYFLVYGEKAGKGDLSEFIPENTAFVVKVNAPGALLDELARENMMWRSLDTSNLLYRLLDNYQLVDSALSKDPSLSGVLFDKPFFMVVVIDSSEGLTPLYLKQASRRVTLNGLKSFLAESNNRLEVTSVDKEILKVISEHDVFYVAIGGGVLRASRQLHLLKSLTGTKTTTGGSSGLHGELTEFVTNSTEKTDARVFINYGALKELPAKHLTEKGERLMSFLTHLALWTETDVKIKKDKLLFSGFTTVDTLNTYLSDFSTQEPYPNKVVNIIPFNTVLLVNQCFSDYMTYSGRSFADDANQIVRETGHEVALVNNAGSGDDFKTKAFAVIHLANGEQSKKAFIKAAKASGSKNEKTYRAYKLRKINDAGFLTALFGTLFSDITANWFTFIEDYVVFANSSGSLEEFIRLFETGKTLDLNENFKTFSDNISTKSNLLVYIKPASALPFVGLFTDESLAKKFKKYQGNFRDIQGMVLQYSSADEKFYTSFFMKHNKLAKEENLALWKVELDDRISGKPALVWDHRTKTYSTVVFDELSNMYLINAGGQVRWKKRIDGPPLSEIFEVDCFKNGKTQYLFNTKDFVYLIDRNGDFVQGYPIKLNPSATNGLSLFDYQKNKDYRIMIAQADKKIYNYTISGKKVKGWGKPKTKDIVKEPVYRIVANGKDYIIISDISNNVLVVNRRGNKRFNLKENLKKARNSAFYPNKTNSKGILITTDKQGQLVYITSSGTLNRTSFGIFSPLHYFLYADFNGNDSYDFLFLDGKDLKVFDKFKKVLFHYTFATDIDEKPVLFDLGRKRKALGVVSSSEKAIYLFDQNGHTIISRGLVGETPFTVGSVENNNELNLITASGNVLYNYRIQ